MSALIDLQPSFRPMHAADLGLVANIERTLYPFPWSRGNFRDCLNAGYDCWITEINSAMTGYGVMLVGSGIGFPVLAQSFTRQIRPVCLRPD